MKIEKTIKVMKEVQETISIKYICDKCGKEIITEKTRINTNKFISKKGFKYPDGGYYDKEDAYFCDNCFGEMKKILLDNGVKFNKISIHW